MIDQHTPDTEWEHLKFWLKTLDVNDLPQRFWNGKRMVYDPEIYIPRLKYIVSQPHSAKDADLIKEIKQLQKVALWCAWNGRRTRNA